jgi:hypothetical protein
MNKQTDYEKVLSEICPTYIELKSASSNMLATCALFCCGGLTRTNDLWVMSPTSYQLLHSAIFCGCKGSALFSKNQIFLNIYFSSEMIQVHSG